MPDDPIPSLAGLEWAQPGLGGWLRAKGEDNRSGRSRTPLRSEGGQPRPGQQGFLDRVPGSMGQGTVVEGKGVQWPCLLHTFEVPWPK